MNPLSNQTTGSTNPTGQQQPQVQQTQSNQDQNGQIAVLALLAMGQVNAPTQNTGAPVAPTHAPQKPLPNPAAFAPGAQPIRSNTLVPPSIHEERKLARARETMEKQNRLAIRQASDPVGFATEQAQKQARITDRQARFMAVLGLGQK